MHTTENFHTPVLLQEVLHYLLSVQDGIFVDGTVGGGGHARAILERLSPRGRLIALDIDNDALIHASRTVESYKDRVTLIHSNFKMLRQVLSDCNVSTINGLLLDLGVSSYQLDTPTKGFSFQTRGMLDMRMNQEGALTAYDVVNRYSEEALATLLWEYGEERQSRKIARAIVAYRKHKAIETTDELVSIIRSNVSKQYLIKTLARVFQAIRIEVNHELDNLRQVLHDGIDLLAKGGRIVVLSYHSLEDRIVKETFKLASGFTAGSNLWIQEPVPVRPQVRVLTKKPIVPSKEEIQRNPRARSAKMRVAEKV
ncbi:MAG: 16S rRNA (cytosine(1402)-N(4))-methyltransferase RsmH [Bacteroidetes bacterium]|nr:16S rRNA (cytosine(1402)-N(4))-methyltransferase RsmH [Bacteroidota bacterium]